MTFIASVIARDGAAVIADSLVTATKPILDYEDFKKYIISKKSGKKPTKSLKIDTKELIGLFKTKPSYTKDYEEKLLEYDKYLAVTTAGTARINNRRISELIDLIREKHHKKGYGPQKIETKMKRFCDFLESEVREHLTKYPDIGYTSFIFTHFDRKIRKVSIFRAWINYSSQKNLAESNYKFVEYHKCYEHEKVVCAGQNRISQGILYGDIDKVFDLVPKTIDKVASDLKLPKEQITEDFKKKVIDYFVSPDSPEVWSTINLLKLTDLSLQQAVDLANLLMTIEIDFQKYTQEIPTVGGVVKVAIINKDGFKFICGNEIEKPKNI